MSVTCSAAAPFRRRRQPAGGVAVKAIIGLVILALFAGGAYLAFGRSGGNASAGSAVEHYTVEKISFEITSTANGELKAKQQTELTNPLERETTITEIVPEGVYVKKGDVLCRLNSDDLQKQLDEELLALESAKADMISANNAYDIQLSDNESSIRKAQTKVEIAQIELQKWLQGDVAEKRKENASKIDSAEREVERLKKNLEQSRELHARQFLSTNDLEKDELAYVEKVSELEIARLKSSVYEEFTYRQEEKKYRSELDDAQAELERARRKAESELASKSAERTNKRQQVTMRQNKVDKYQEQIRAATILAPTDGLVVYATSINNRRWWGSNEGPMKVGRKVYPNEAIIVLPDTTEMIAAIKIHESIVSQIKPGQQALVTIDAKQGRKFTGKVESIGIMAEGGGWMDPNLREYEVQISIDLGEGDHGLKPSMRCEAQIIRDHVADAIAVPIQAVFTDGPVPFVYRDKGGRYERQPVRIGRRSDTRAEVLAGLSGGESVLLRTPEPGRVIKGDFDPKVLAALGISTDKAGPGGARGARGPRMVLAANSAAEGGDGVKPDQKPEDSAPDADADAGDAPDPGAEPAPPGEAAAAAENQADPDSGAAEVKQAKTAPAAKSKADRANASPSR